MDQLHNSLIRKVWEYEQDLLHHAISSSHLSQKAQKKIYTIHVTKRFSSAVMAQPFPSMRGSTDLHARPFAQEFGTPKFIQKGFGREFSSNEDRKKGILLVEHQPTGQYKATIFFFGSGGLSNFTEGLISFGVYSSNKKLQAKINTSEAMWKLICIGFHSGILMDKEDGIVAAIQALQSAHNVTDATKATRNIGEFLSGYWDHESTQAMFATIAAKWAESVYMAQLLRFFTQLFIHDQKDIIPGLNIWNCAVEFIEGNPFDGRWGVRKNYEQAKELLVGVDYNQEAWKQSLISPDDKNLLGSVIGEVFEDLKARKRNQVQD